MSVAFEYLQNFGQQCNNSCKNLGARPFWSGTNIMAYGSNDYCNLIKTNTANLNDFAVVGRQISEDISGASIVPLHL